ncbi:MAG: endonuclease/exonuclease/phosphatase family protein [Phycisphaerales bacterium]|nr:endonuclease/exonuclease/phosphatase family protein [Phycisphaerales bacterium]
MKHRIPPIRVPGHRFGLPTFMREGVRRHVHRLVTAGALVGVFALAGTHAAAQSGRSSTARAEKPAHKYGYPTPKPRTEGAIRIATYNMLNFFDQVNDPTLEGEFDDLPMATDPDRCRNLANAIRAVNADVIGLEEVESKEAIEWFRDTYLKDMGYTYCESIDVGYFRGVENAVLSRFPITEARTWINASLDDVKRIGPGWDDVPTADRSGMTFRRSPLMVTIKPNDAYELTIFIVHHKSGGLKTMYWREAEALKIVEYIKAIEAQDPDRNIIVMGDFNSAPWDKSMRVYFEAGMIDTLGHRIVPHWKNPDPVEPALYKTHESDRVLDYILINSATARELVIGSAHVYGTLTPPDSYDYRKDPFPKGYASDHYPVMIELMPKDRL